MTQDTTGRMSNRALIAKGVGARQPESAIAYCAAQNWADRHAIEQHLKGTVTGIVSPGARDEVALDTRAAIRLSGALGHLPAARRVPLQIRIVNVDAGFHGTGLVEGQPIPVSQADLSGVTLQARRFAALVITSEELLRFGAAGGERFLALELAAAVAEAEDRALLNPDDPGSILADATEVPATANLDDDLADALTALVGSNMQNVAWITTPAVAIKLSLARGSGGDLKYGGVSPKGGSLLGLPLIVTAGAPTGVLAAVDQEALSIAEGPAEFAVSSNAAFELRDDPSNNTATGTPAQVVSMFQNHCLALRGTSFANWAIRGFGAAYISNIE